VGWLLFSYVCCFRLNDLIDDDRLNDLFDHHPCPEAPIHPNISAERHPASTQTAKRT
jgi:hypothetical protein